MRVFASWWERLRNRHVLPALFIALAFGAALPHHLLGKLLSGAAGFIWN